MDTSCVIKLPDESQPGKLEWEKTILERIRERDRHLESPKFIVNWLYPEFLSEDRIFFLNSSGNKLFPSLAFSSSSCPSVPLQASVPVRCLVLESGGKNLKEFLKDETLSSVPISQRIHILEEVVKAVSFLHRMGVVHFDLKAENIVSFISSGDGKIRWKLVDFDSSFEEGSSSRDDLWVTDKFISPEVANFTLSRRQQQQQQQQQVIANQTNSSDMNLLPNLPPLTINWTMDIWSLGMVAYFLFTNHTIWDHSVVDVKCETVAEVTQEEIKKIISKERSMGGKEKSFVESCLLVQPSDRLSAAELLKKTLFTTRDSTYNAFKITNESMMSRLDQIQILVQAFTDRSPSQVVTQELSEKFSDLNQCLSSQLERFSFLTREDIKALFKPPVTSDF
jgi:serine/threonine protein kinase